MYNYSQLILQAEIWLRENPERLTTEEKQKFKANLFDFLIKKEPTIDDEVYDFLVNSQIISNISRHVIFFRYLSNKYGNFKGLKTLDVGAGRMCHLSALLAKKGAHVTAIDPSIRLTTKEAHDMKIKEIQKKIFVCDEFARNNNGTDISNSDLIVGLEPCMATEHIIRQGLKHDKPFDVTLCATNHSALNGEKFKNVEDWYKYLRGISCELEIDEYKNTFIITNNTTVMTNQKILLPSEPEL